MHFDIISSMTIYAIATVTFYLLDAGISYGMGKAPKGADMTNIYTQTLGEWSLWLCYIGAMATLYGTIFASTAAHSRLFADMFRLLRFFDAVNYQKRVAYRNRFVVLLTVIPALLFLTFQSPLKMAVARGFAQAIALPVIGIGTIYLRHRRLPGEIAPSRPITVLLWLATIVITCLLGYYVILEVRKL